MARKATSLGPKPSLFLFVCFVFFFPFLSLLLLEKPVFPPRKGIFVYFESPPLFLLSLFWPPPFTVSLSLSLSCFFSFFLFVFPFCFLLVPCFLSFILFLSSWLLFHERDNIKRFNCKLFLFINPLYFCFLSCFSLKSVFVFVFFLIFSFVFFNINVVGFKKHKLKNTILWSRGGCNKTFFFYQPVFSKLWKVIVYLGGPFWGKFWVMFKKNTIK